MPFHYHLALCVSLRYKTGMLTANTDNIVDTGGRLHRTAIENLDKLWRKLSDDASSAAKKDLSELSDLESRHQHITAAMNASLISSDILDPGKGTQRQERCMIGERIGAVTDKLAQLETELTGLWAD